jgi:hypothetical protein
VHRDEEFVELPIARHAYFDFDGPPDDGRAPNEFCFHGAPRKTLVYPFHGRDCELLFGGWRLRPALARGSPVCERIGLGKRSCGERFPS